MDPSQLPDLIKILIVPVAIFAYVSSHFLDTLGDQNPWNKLSAWQKQLIILAVSLVIGFVAFFVQKNASPEQIARWQELWTVAYNIFVAWIAMFIQHSGFVAQKDRKALRAAHVQTQVNIAEANRPKG